MFKKIQNILLGGFPWLGIIILFLFGLSLVFIILFIRQVTITRELTEKLTLEEEQPLETEEGPGPFLEEEIPYRNFDLLVKFEPETKALFLEWKEGVVIKEIIVSELEKDSPNVKKIVFALSPVVGQNLPRPYRIGTLPENWKITEGNLTTEFSAGTQYKVEVIAQEKGEEFRGLTYFAL